MREEIKKQIEAVRRGEVPEGYKRTDSGIMPTEWPNGTVGRIIEFYGEKSTVNNEYPVLTSARSGLVLQTDYFEGQVTREENAGYNVIPYGYVTYRSRSDDGRFSFNQNQIIDKGIVSCFYPVFRIKEEEAAPKFVLSYLNNYLGRQIVKEIVGTSQLVLSEKKLAELRLPCPPLAEQQKIADILATCDRVIELKQQLLEEKRLQKQWLRQRLLTPQQEWRKATIGQIALVTTGATPDTKHSEYWGGNIRWMNSGELNLKHVHEVEGRITDAGLRKSGTKLIPANCVLIGLAGQGKTRGTAAINHVELCTNQSIAAIHPGNQFDSEYLYHYLDSKYLELRKISSGDGARGGLNLDLIEGFVIYLPDVETQRKIADMLTVADDEMLLLEQERDEWMKKKKALMQLLLTGLVRVNA